MAAQGLKAEIMSARVGMQEDEYWEFIDGLASNALGSTQMLSELRMYADKHDESILGDEAENYILRFCGLLKY